MQKASISIKFDDFCLIARDMLTEAQCKELFLRACKIPPVRVSLLTKTVNRKQVIKTLRSGDAGLFNKILTGVRLGLNHKFTPIDTHSNEWTQILQYSADADDFCETFGFGKDQGYKVYIEKCLKFMSNPYRLSKFSYYKDKIFASQQSLEDINKDQNKELTEKLYRLYLRLVNIRHNDAFYRKHHADFVYTADRCLKSKVKPDRYLEIQFNFFKNFGKVPEPSWLHTNEAFERTFKDKRE